jgi:ABC-type branched-subunit amino acid transport system ATPase component
VTQSEVGGEHSPVRGVASLASAILDEESHRLGADAGTGVGPSPRATRASESEAVGAALLELRGIDFSYGKVQVLFSIDLSVRRGDSIALLGTNGAGKSTLLRCISGLETPARGHVWFGGSDITTTSAESRARMGIVQLTGGNATFPPLTVAENLRAAAYQYARREADTRVERALSLFAVLRDRLRVRASDLSGGQQQILALAIALMHDPKILIIDEMSMGLAPVVVQQVVDVVQGLREQGTTLIIVEQSLNVALSLAERAVVMEKGQIQVDGRSDELDAQGDLVCAVFLGK